MSSKLDVLAKSKEQILLAEVAGLLHDIGKFCDRHIQDHCGGQKRSNRDAYKYKAVVDNPADCIHLSQKAHNLKKPDELNNVLKAQSPKAADFLSSTTKEALETASISIDSQETYTLGELIMLGSPGFAAHKNRANLLSGKDGWLPALLGVCHSAAHHDKQEPGKDSTHSQCIPSVLVSSPFGHEFQTFILGDPHNSLDARLKNLPITPSTLTSRDMIDKILAEFSKGLGDTRRPINEVTLADWSATVAALFKAAVAATVLTSNKPDIRQWASKGKKIDHDLRWRLLRISFNGLAFLERAPSVPDLLGRQQALKDALNKVKHLLEDKYPLGNEVYRDENGSAFVVPALEGDDDNGTKIRSLVETLIQDDFRQSDLQGELAPCLSVTQASCNAATLHQELAKPLQPSHVFVDAIQFWWQGQKVDIDICTVCGLRPRGWDAPSDQDREKSESRGVCYVCLKRRGHRAAEWINPQSDRAHQTIWLDEVGDVNGRICLVAGQFALNDWLKPEGFVETLLIDPPNPNAANGPVPNNPSFARLRRIWETTRQFWQDITNQIADKNNHIVDRVDARLRIDGTFKADSGNTSRDPVPTHAYEILSGNTRISIACVANDKFLVIENLQYIAQLLNKKCVTYADALAHIQTLLRAQRTLPVEEPTGYGRANTPLGKLHVTDVKPDDMPYTPVIPILAEPRTFMALVPADRALAVAETIKRKYETEMGKVRNRLPLTLGLVFADRRMPLVAILDAGRRMVQMGSSDGTVGSERWKVEEKVNEQPVPQTDPWPRAVTLTLCKDGRALSLSVPTVMGDGSTPDKWYPYWCVEQDASGNKPTGRPLQFTGPDGKEWVHVCQLEEGDTVAFVPSRFDFVFLDTAARRFAVSYDRSIQKDGDDAQRQGQPQDGGGRLRRRGPAGRTRPYYLEHLGELTARGDRPAGAATATPQSDGRDSLWDILADGLTTTQIHNLVGLIETKRQEWEQSRETFEQFVHEAILNANWQEGKHPAGCELKRLQDAAISGELADAVELHTQILKRKSAIDPEEAK